MPTYDIFSKRDRPLPDVFQTRSIPETLRTQIMWMLGDSLFRLEHQPAGMAFGDPANFSVRNIRAVICRERGVRYLHTPQAAPEQDFASAVTMSKDTTLVLDIVELSFAVLLDSEDPRIPDKDDLIEELNYRFRENGVGFQFDPDARRLIPVDNLITHQEIVRPALQLLSAPQYATANQEYIEAFDDYKKRDYDDCLTKSCSCLESVMKIICHQKGWPYDQRATAQPLLNTVISNTGIPPFFEQPLMLIATLRNRLSSSHGSGTAQSEVPEYLARYALHATASAILLLVEAAK